MFDSNASHLGVITHLGQAQIVEVSGTSVYSCYAMLYSWCCIGACSDASGSLLSITLLCNRAFTFSSAVKLERQSMMTPSGWE